MRENVGHYQLVGGFYRYCIKTTTPSLWAVKKRLVIARIPPKGSDVHLVRAYRREVRGPLALCAMCYVTYVAARGARRRRLYYRL
jgi:hypothetical protein